MRCAQCVRMECWRSTACGCSCHLKRIERFRFVLAEGMDYWPPRLLVGMVAALLVSYWLGWPAGVLVAGLPLRSRR